MMKITQKKKSPKKTNSTKKMHRPRRKPSDPSMVGGAWWKRMCGADQGAVRRPIFRGSTVHPVPVQSAPLDHPQLVAHVPSNYRHIGTDLGEISIPVPISPKCQFWLSRIPEWHLSAFGMYCTGNTSVYISNKLDIVPVFGKFHVLFQNNGVSYFLFGTSQTSVQFTITKSHNHQIKRIADFKSDKRPLLLIFQEAALPHEIFLVLWICFQLTKSPQLHQRMMPTTVHMMEAKSIGGPSPPSTNAVFNAQTPRHVRPFSNSVIPHSRIASSIPSSSRNAAARASQRVYDSNYARTRPAADVYRELWGEDPSQAEIQQVIRKAVNNTQSGVSKSTVRRRLGQKINLAAELASLNALKNQRSSEIHTPEEIAEMQKNAEKLDKGLEERRIAALKKDFAGRRKVLQERRVAYNKRRMARKTSSTNSDLLEKEEQIIAKAFLDLREEERRAGL